MVQRPTTATASPGTTISAPAQPSRANYAFAGWFTADSDGTQVDFPYTVTGDVSLYAQWTSTDITFTADPQNGAAPYGTTQHSAFVIVPGEPLYAGHTFAGWWTAPTGGTLKPSQFDVDSTITVYAHWTLNSHTVTFEPGNGTAATDQVAGYGTAIPAPDAARREARLFLRRLVYGCERRHAGHVPVHGHRRRNRLRALALQHRYGDARPAERCRVVCDASCSE